jgi:DNA polymerase III subunit alpha
MSDFTVVNHPTQEGDKAIRFGLGAIKNVGEGAIDSIIKERQSGVYSDFSDLCMRIDLKQANKRVLESLIKAGATDDLGDRSQLMGIYARVMERAVVLAKEKSNGQVSLFGEGMAGCGLSIDDLVNEGYVSISNQSRLRMEKEMLGLYISGHPLDDYADTVAAMSHTISSIVVDEDGLEVSLCGMLTECRRFLTKTNREMCAGTLEDANGSLSVLLFQTPKFEALAPSFIDEHVVTLKGKVKVNGDEIAIVVSDIVVIDQTSLLKKIFIDVEHVKDAGILKQIRDITRSFKGPLPLYFKHGESMILAHQKYWLNEDPNLRLELEGLLGPGRIWMN